MRKLIISLIFLLILSSCFSGKKDEKLLVKDEIKRDDLNEELKIKIKTGKTAEDKKIVKNTEVRVSNGVLDIGNGVRIREGMSEKFPNDVPIIDNSNIYQNSNIDEYAFIVVNDSDYAEIYNYYKKELPKNGWKLSNTGIDLIEELPIDNNAEDVILYDDLIYINNNGNKELVINISEEIPKILVDNLNLEGIFVEFNFTDLYIQGEESPNL